MNKLKPCLRGSDHDAVEMVSECVMCGETFTETDLTELREMGEAYHREVGCFLCPDCWDSFRRMDPEEQMKHPMLLENLGPCPNEQYDLLKAQLLGLAPVPIVHGDCGATNEADARRMLGIEPKEGA